MSLEPVSLSMSIDAEVDEPYFFSVACFVSCCAVKVSDRRTPSSSSPPDVLPNVRVPPSDCLPEKPQPLDFWYDCWLLVVWSVLKLAVNESGAMLRLSSVGGFAKSGEA